jgi:hypothetical protein
MTLVKEPLSDSPHSPPAAFGPGGRGWVGLQWASRTLKGEL